MIEEEQGQAQTSPLRLVEMSPEEATGLGPANPTPTYREVRVSYLSIFPGVDTKTLTKGTAYHRSRFGGTSHSG